MSSVHPVGFSLGAQVAGHLGYKLNGKLSRITGKCLSEALIFASTNPQYEHILFFELQVQYMKIPSSEHGENM